MQIPLAHLEDLESYMLRDLGQNAIGAIPVYVGAGLGMGGTGWDIIQPTANGYALFGASGNPKGLSYAPGATGGGLIDQSVDKRHLTVTARANTSWGPTGSIDSTFPRNSSRTTSISHLSLGRLSLLGGIIIPRDTTVTSISVLSGTTAATSPTHQWFCLVDQNGNVLKKTVDDTTTAWNASAVKTLALSSTYTPTADTAVYLGIVVTGGVVPTLVGDSGTAAVNGLLPMTSATANSGLTDPASLGATVGALTASTAFAYAYGYIS